MELSSYIAYLLSEPGKASCVKASEVLSISHDEVNRFLLSGQWSGKDLFDAVKEGIALEGGTLTADDTVLDKPFTNPAVVFPKLGHISIGVRQPYLIEHTVKVFCISVLYEDDFHYNLSAMLLQAVLLQKTY